MLNTTFTTGGLTAPIFVTIYFLTPDEIPENNIVRIPIKGFTSGSERDLCSSKVQYVNFVRGQCDYFGEINDNNQGGSDQGDNATTTYPISK